MNREREKRMFGCTIKEVEDVGRFYRSNKMAAMSILSDVQEIINPESEWGGHSLEEARQWINKAKYLISKEFDDPGKKAA